MISTSAGSAGTEGDGAARAFDEVRLLRLLVLQAVRVCVGTNHPDERAVEVERVRVRAADGVYLVELARDDRQRVLRARALGPRLGFGRLADWIQPTETLRAELCVAGRSQDGENGEESEEPGHHPFIGSLSQRL